jgi:DNA repair exonuclease SbcCD nuclease subunit
LRETGNIFTIFEHLENVYPIHDNRYETVSVQTNNETAMIHAIPQCQTPKEFDMNFKKIALDHNVDYNLLIAHGAVAGIKEFKMNEFNELFIPVKTVQQDFDYIALGHYHMYTKLQENAFYAGSTEHLSFTEANIQKGCLEIDHRQKLKHRFIPQNTTRMVDVPPLDCSVLNAEQIVRKTKETILSIEPKDKIIRIRLENIPSHVQRGIDFHQLRTFSKTAVHFEIKSTTMKADETSLSEGYKMKSLADEYEKFLNIQPYSEKEMLLKLGLHYINKIEEQDE